MVDCHDNEITEMHLQITKTPVVSTVQNAPKNGHLTTYRTYHM